MDFFIASIFDLIYRAAKLGAQYETDACASSDTTFGPLAPIGQPLLRKVTPMGKHRSINDIVRLVNMVLDQAYEKRQAKDIPVSIVGALLAIRFGKGAVRTPDMALPPWSLLGGSQSALAGLGFILASTQYYVSVAPEWQVIDKCRASIDAGLHPVLLAPRGEQVEKARHIAEDRGLRDRVTILAIEEFITFTVIGMSSDNQQKFVDVLKEIIRNYNTRFEQVETDMSLKIEVD